jgi:hypothetical protein
MRMDRQADVGRVAAHLDRERDLRDEIAGVRPTMPPPITRCVPGRTAAS